jgi:desulfoferrodoxin-like iron-binding protein
MNRTRKSFFEKDTYYGPSQQGHNKERSLEMVEANKVGEIFKCEICGNVVEVKEAGGGELVCCGEPMKPVE